METAPQSILDSFPLGFLLAVACVIGAVIVVRMLRRSSVRHDPLEGAQGAGGAEPLGQGTSTSRQDANPDEVRARIAELAARGQKIEAIKLYRDLTGAGLKEAKDAVEAGNFGAISGVQETSSPASGSRQASIGYGELRALIESGQKIEAIKRYREMTGVGLKEAKDAVEHWAAHPDAMPDADLAQAAGTETLNDEVSRLQREGRAIEAVKLVRERLGLGLSEAKDYVDRIR